MTLNSAFCRSLLLLVLCAPTLQAADAPAKEAAAADLALIRAESKAFVDTFNAKDAAGVANCWTPEGEFIDDSGRRFVGRDQIAKFYAAGFVANPDTKIRLAIDSLRLLSDTTAIEEGRSIIDPHPAGAPGHSKYVAIHVKLDGKWKMASVRDTWVAIASNHEKVADLEWLIGSWTAEHGGATMESTCRWIAGKSFVERRYSTTLADGTVTSGVQIIGWNGAIEKVQSWNFTSDGGHAVGTWTATENGWIAELQGMAGNGTPTTAVNTLARLDDNAYMWQSTNRTVAGNPIPDTEEIVLKRNKGAK
ncbi:hypothetical protein Psta_3465 [Pirellula staleyi DSM 6068]|uniref:DUF4440 domain-containing protein n=1 Tax=Pirellula staleyi (strain ATCC 27377 / DSM 6068 / ICPB 4128) TaxID=530564 RepID=D2QYG8_PIRSD|nr:SgcJ/EcaC family oxidoreductase [Pirellula staleyi]ADB18127.1 hypothetical protein Psta_3465 [Pirellula staleyi DSM 6068]